MSEEAKTVQAPPTAAYHWRPLDNNHVAIGVNIPLDNGGKMTLFELVIQRSIADSFAKWVLAAWPTQAAPAAADDVQAPTPTPDAPAAEEAPPAA